MTTKTYDKGYYQRFLKTKRAAGWRFIGAIVPQEVYQTLIDTKRDAMAVYRLKNPQTIN